MLGIGLLACAAPLKEASGGQFGLGSNDASGYHVGLGAELFQLAQLNSQGATSTVHCPLTMPQPVAGQHTTQASPP